MWIVDCGKEMETYFAIGIPSASAIAIATVGFDQQRFAAGAVDAAVDGGGGGGGGEVQRWIAG
jgi:hypothetical protein